MPKALRDELPRFESDERDPTQDVFVYPGAMRLVSPRRARKLRKRGVHLMPLHAVRDPSGVHRPGSFYPTSSGKARYAWFELQVDADTRKHRRAANCYETWRDANNGAQGRKAWLRERLEDSRADHEARKYFRMGARAAATMYFQTYTTYSATGHNMQAQSLGRGLRAVGSLQAADTYAANPQLDLYVQAWRAMQPAIEGIPRTLRELQDEALVAQLEAVDMSDIKTRLRLATPGVHNGEYKMQPFEYDPMSTTRPQDFEPANAGVPTHFVVCPTCLLVPVLCRCKGSQDNLAG